MKSLSNLSVQEIQTVAPKNIHHLYFTCFLLRSKCTCICEEMCAEIDKYNKVLKVEGLVKRSSNF